MEDRRQGESERRKEEINLPARYSGRECWDSGRYFSAGLFSVWKYVWRYQQKGGVVDLQKALWYAKQTGRSEAGELAFQGEWTVPLDARPYLEGLRAQPPNALLGELARVLMEFAIDSDAVSERQQRVVKLLEDAISQLDTK